MKLHRSVTVTSALMGIVLSVGSLGTPASAAPNKIGPVANLTLTAAAATGGGYSVTSSWTPLAGATAYKITLTSAGVTVASVTQTSPPWNATLNLTPNSQLQVSVQPMEGKKPGIAASAVHTLPDLAPPVGVFALSTSGMDATITQTSLSDDATPADQITRIVSWGDGSTQNWLTGTTVTHNYAAIGRYVPTVTLADSSGNTVVVTVKAAVFGDSSAPAANYASGPASAIAKWTKVNLNQESLSDNYTPSELIERTVSWGDGSAPEQWKEGATLTHVYTVAGTFTPSVVTLDEAGNQSKTAADPITVTVDAVGPAVTIAKAKAASKVRSWRTVKGTAKDAGVGTASVALVAVEKRGDKWFAYSATTRTWLKAGTKAKAWKKAVAVAGAMDGDRWKARIKGLRKGKLLLRASATDHVGNVSKLAVRAAKLTS